MKLAVCTQGRPVPEGLRGCRGGGRLRRPRSRLRHPAGEPALPRGRGRKGQGCVRKQGGATATPPLGGMSSAAAAFRNPVDGRVLQSAARNVKLNAGPRASGSQSVGPDCRPDIRAAEPWPLTP